MPGHPRRPVVDFETRTAFERLFEERGSQSFPAQTWPGGQRWTNPLTSPHERRATILRDRSYGIWLGDRDPFAGEWFAVGDLVFTTQEIGVARAQILHLIRRGEVEREARIVRIGDQGLPDFAAYIPGELPAEPRP